MKKIIFFLFLSLQLSAQEFVVKKGVVMDDLKVSDTLEESYALYLPTTYKNERPWPVLFVFDGEGRGRAAAQLFKTTAEEQGYIIVSSNSISQQNNLEQNTLAGARLMQHIAGILPIDSRQIASVGSAAGAKVASAIPLIFDDIHGVVAVGDHWVNFNLLDNKKNFNFIGIVGDEQFTASGMQSTASTLSRLRFPTQIYTYSGNEDWPQPQIINSAVGSLTLEAMREGFRPVDPQLVEQLYRQDLARVNKLMSLNQLVTAESLLEIMEDKYDGLISTAEIRSKQNQLARSRNYSQQKREQGTVTQKEARLMEDFIYYLEEDIRKASFENLGWWNYQKNQLDSLAQKNNAEAKMALRLQDFIREYVEIKKREFKERRTPLENKLVANMIQTIFDPRAYDAYREIISLSAQDNDFSTAYFYLEEMLKHGYNDMETLYNIEGTLGLRLTPEYNQIINHYLGDSRFYDAKMQDQK
ncbi:hypothetical protein [Salinimicrobium terrae]|uniref:hypothetical protein n=1 Tax=Salinimicrobium terrae TaxID=470866 RepID=UPI00040CAEA6|nr:hypothetical protein [Salinimicrobium terrae]